VEDWQAAVAAVDHPEMQIRGNVYSPYDMSCGEMIEILESVADPEYNEDEYDSLIATMRTDFDTLSQHGYNLIRIYYGPKVDATADPCSLRLPDLAMFVALDTLLALLEEEDLKRYISLTGAKDWAWDDGDPTCERIAVSDTQRYRAWLDSFLVGGRGYANDSTIVCWDLRTEGEPGDDTCNTWIGHILPYLQSVDTTTPVTRGLGCGSPGGTEQMRLLGDFDIYTIHPYQKEKGDVDPVTGDTTIIRRWSTLPDSVASARTGSWEHTVQFGEFGFPVYKQKDYHVDQMPEMEQRQLYRNLFYKMWELGITKANVFKMYDKMDKTSFGVYRDDRSFKPSGELIAQLFSGASWDTIPIIGNWHMELDDRYNWKNLWKPDPTCTENDTCGSLQPSCWRNKIWSDEGDTSYITFEWDTAGGDTSNHTDPEIFTLFTPRASLKIIMDPPEDDTLEASWYFRCCGPGLKERTAVAPGVSYTCSAYVWIEGSPDSVGLGIRWFDVSGDSISTSYTYISGNTFNASQWDVLTYTDESPSTAYSCIVSCNVRTTDMCTVWIDDVQLYEALKWKTYYPDTVVITYGDTTTEDKSKLVGDDGDCFSFGSQRVLEGQNYVQKIDWYSEVEISEDPDDVTGLAVAYYGHYDLEDTVKQFICLRYWDANKYDTLCATDALASCKNFIRQADITHGWSTDVDSIAQRYIHPDYRTIRMRVVIEPESSVDSCRCWADYKKYSVSYKTE
jgi:hypothetical protein